MNYKSDTLKRNRRAGSDVVHLKVALTVTPDSITARVRVPADLPLCVVDATETVLAVSFGPSSDSLTRAGEPVPRAEALVVLPERVDPSTLQRHIETEILIIRIGRLK